MVNKGKTTLSQQVYEALTREIILGRVLDATTYRLVERLSCGCQARGTDGKK